jgi:cell division protein FtsI/penicillin-binding protein 2
MIRIWTVYTGLLIICLLIVIRLFYWMIIQGPKLRLEAESQYFHQLPLPAQRGVILAQDGSPLVINQPAGLVYAQPKDIKDVSRFIKEIAPILAVDEASLSAQLSLPDRVWIPLARKVDMKRVQQLQDLKLDGLGIEKESKRFYPEASMAAHILGFVGSDQNGGDKGYFGIEGYYDRELHGKDGVIQMEKDVKGVPILLGESHRVEPENGRTLVLWLDRTVQHIVEQKLKDGIEKYGAKEE